MKTKSARALVVLLGSLLVVVSPAIQAADDLPKTTPEGMELVKQTKSRIVYVMPGATLEPYTKVALLDCFVAFRKDWKKDHNRSAAFELRVDDKDMERIKSDLAAEFRNVFEKELTDAGHEIVDHTGPDVLVIRPAIINLDVTAPDVNAAGMTRTIVRSAGEMTLFMELYDSTTSAIIARIMDAESADRGGLAMEATRMRNKAEADRVLRSWAKELAGHLGEAQSAISSPGE